MPEKTHRWRAWLRSWTSSRVRIGAIVAVVLLIGIVVSIVGLNESVRGGLAGALDLNSALGDSAHADPLPPLKPVPYSHSWYIDQPDMMTEIGQRDAKWLNQQTESGVAACSTEYLTVLDFGHPTRKGATGSSLDDYAMSMFGKQDAWRTYREIEQLAKTYIDSWMASVSSCPRLVLVMGTSNFAQCSKSVGPCDVYTAGKYWDIVAHDVADYVTQKGYGSRITGVWVGDDAETSWDPWPVTAQFLYGVRDQERTYQTHARMVNYGDANIGACSEVTGGCDGAWTPENVYDAAWGIGWAVPLPEAYTPTTIQRWVDVANVMSMGPSPREFMQFHGFMTQCGEADPLPLDGCYPAGESKCQFSPAVAYQRLHAADKRHPLTYATNIQWLQPQTNEPGSAAHPCF